MHVDPWESIFIRDQTIDEIVYAMIYYTMQSVDESGDVDNEFIRVEWYDSEKIYYYNETKDHTFEPDPKKPFEPHNFKAVPLIEFPNKEERQGDFEKVRSLINSYDLIQSNNIDELEAFRKAYLIFHNVDITADFLNKMRDTGALDLPEDGKIEWLTKQVNGEFTESVLQRIKGDIYRFAKAVDMSDEKFSGDAQSGESRKWKLKTLSDDAILKEREFKNACRRMFDVVKTYLNLFNLKFEGRFVDLQFTPNLPADLQYHAEVTTKLYGKVSEETRLSLLPFVDDPIEEMQKMDEESTPAKDFNAELANLGIDTTNQ
jgi:SPP1 family phage portal protein